MDKKRPLKKQSIHWSRWLGLGLAAVVVVAIAQPVGQFIELFCALSHMGPS